MLRLPLRPAVDVRPSVAVADDLSADLRWAYRFDDTQGKSRGIAHLL